MSKMTPWFPPKIKPVRVGVYQIRFNFNTYIKDPMYATWNGKRWSNFSHREDGHWLNIYSGAEQKKIWRGFTEEQK